MPVHFADNWTLTRMSDTSPLVVTFWLHEQEKVSKYAKNIKKTNKLNKKKTETFYQHVITTNKFTYSPQINAWLINDGTHVFTFHLNRRDYNPIYANTKKMEEDDDDYVKMKKEFLQSEEEIKYIIDPSLKPVIVAEEVPEEEVAQEGWITE